MEVCSFQTTDIWLDMVSSKVTPMFLAFRDVLTEASLSKILSVESLPLKCDVLKITTSDFSSLSLSLLIDIHWLKSQMQFLSFSMARLRSFSLERSKATYNYVSSV